MLGFIDGADGSNVLDYSAYKTGVTVNLGAGTTDLPVHSATGVAGGAAEGISHFATVLVGDGNNYLTAVGASFDVSFSASGSGNNIMVGGSGVNTLIASGTGNNIVIGGRGASTIYGGSGYNLLVGGYTDFDAASADLQVIGNVWKTVNSATKYAKAVSQLSTLSYAYSLTAATVHGNAGDSIHAGTHALDWYFAALAGALDGDNAGETHMWC
jgi:Ca2+-binding RTX toxin-like protein